MNPKVQQLGPQPMLDSVVWESKCSKEEEITTYLHQITDVWYIWIATLLYQYQVIIFWLAATQNTWYFEDRWGPKTQEIESKVTFF